MSYLLCGFIDYPALRQHCSVAHKEEISRRDERDLPKGWMKPCRFFRNGEGFCNPRSGSCQYDHTIIPDNEREPCFHKQKCSYKPYCIFYHPEGQDADVWQSSRKVAKVCHYIQNGEVCIRTHFNFFHPSVVTEEQDFQRDQVRKPPLVEPAMTSTMESIPRLPRRI